MSTIAWARSTSRRSAGRIWSRSSGRRRSTPRAPRARSPSCSRSRSSTSTGSRTRPRRSRRSRTSSSSIANNEQAVNHLLSVYEKRRDWEKLIKLREAEVERTPMDERAAKVIEVARMAATKVKKPEICTFWWEKVIEYEPTHEEALAELYKLYERNKEWEKLADISSRQADAAPDDKARADALQRLGLLYTEKVENSAKAIARLAAAARDRREQPPRPGRAEEALRHRGPLGRSRGVLPLAQQDRRVHPRARARGRGRQRAAPAAARDEDRDPLPRRAAEAGSRDARVREGADARRGEPRRGRGADPAVRGRPRSEGARARARDPAPRDRGARTCARSAWRSSRATARRSCATRGRPSGGGCARTPRTTRTRRSRTRSSGWPARSPAGTSSSRRTAPRCRSSSAARTRCALMLVVARVIEKEQGEVDRALEMNRSILEIDEGNEQALDALQRLYLGKGQFQELLDIYERKLNLTHDGDERIAIQSKIGQLYEDEVKDDDRGDRRLQGHPRRRRRRADGAALPRSRLPAQPALERSGRHPRPAAHDRRARGRQGRPHRSSSTGSARSRSSTSTTPVARSTRTATSSISTRRTTGARGALEAHLPSRRPEAQAGGRRHPRADLRAARRVGPARRRARDPATRPRTTRCGESTLLLRIGELQRTKLVDGEKAFDAYARAFTRRPRHRGRQGRARGARACSTRTAGPSADHPLRGRARRREDIDPVAGPRAGHQGGAVLRGPARTTAPRRSSSTAGRSRSSPTI